ncbi:hypothetical protein EVAR_40603_1 [Eumeta japonica]|uniref:Uncharacterized protein n=1 Tax=Eumeta variegata TaxID=151549 RepID=A0A4C1XG41_EUMVA|nr:hypothetical protein EVAR_40603_1 [Eumeta japonica]
MFFYGTSRCKRACEPPKSRCLPPPTHTPNPREALLASWVGTACLMEGQRADEEGKSVDFAVDANSGSSRALVLIPVDPSPILDYDPGLAFDPSPFKL